MTEKTGLFRRLEAFESSWWLEGDHERAGP